MAIVGNLPVDLGLVDINPTEMMFWLYCPIKLPGSHSVKLPSNLTQFDEITESVYYDVKVNERWSNEFDNRWYDSYVYLTAKTLYVAGGYIGNRPGWHCDGFGTNDLNYIWYSSAPTDFFSSGIFGINVSDDCDESMRDMECASQFHKHVQYPCKHLLKLDPTVIHRPPVKFEPGMRTFVKVSVSDHKYNLEGNSINHALNLDVDFQPRGVERNHPCKDFES